MLRIEVEGHGAVGAQGVSTSLDTNGLRAWVKKSWKPISQADAPAVTLAWAAAPR